jgi:hypothetical protein
MDNLDDQQISSEDIEMLNSHDFLESKPLESHLDSDKSDSLEDSFFVDSDTKTPGEILDEFCMKLDDVNTTMPDQVINHYMKKAGFIVNDPKLVKIISIASQKFVSEIVNDVMQHHKLKTKSATSQSNASATQAASSTTAANSKTTAQDKTKGGATSNSATTSSNSNGPQSSNAASASSNSGGGNTAPLTLTLEDLSQVLTEYGINVKKPYYFM